MDGYGWQEMGEIDGMVCQFAPSFGATYTEFRPYSGHIFQIIKLAAKTFFNWKQLELRMTLINCLFTSPVLISFLFIR